MRYSTPEIHIPIKQLKAFTSSGAVRGEWLNPEKTILGIYSYQTLMAAIFKETKRAFINRNKYSVTTSKHQGKIRFGISQGGYLVDNITADELAEVLEPWHANIHPSEWADPIA